MIEIIIVIAFLIYIGYKEYLTNERIKDLELKAFTKSPQEYAQLKHIDTPIKETKSKEEDDLVDPSDVDPKDALKGMVK